MIYLRRRPVAPILHLAYRAYLGRFPTHHGASLVVLCFGCSRDSQPPETMSSIGCTFHLFSRLSPELHDEIWRCCLPHRVHEMDVPSPEIIFGVADADDPVPCTLEGTTINNRRPPLLWSVCHQSRAVASATGSHVHCTTREPVAEDWLPSHDLCWQDRLRDSAHFNWCRSYDIIDRGYRCHPFSDVVQEALRLSGRGL